MYSKFELLFFVALKAKQCLLCLSQTCERYGFITKTQHVNWFSLYVWLKTICLPLKFFSLYFSIYIYIYYYEKMFITIIISKTKVSLDWFSLFECISIHMGLYKYQCGFSGEHVIWFSLVFKFLKHCQNKFLFLFLTSITILLKVDLLFMDWQLYWSFNNSKDFNLDYEKKKYFVL